MEKKMSVPEVDPLTIHEYRKVMAQQIAAELFDRAVEDSLNWESYPELGEYDWEAIAEMVRQKGPGYPADYQRIEAWNGLVGRNKDDHPHEEHR